MPAFDRFVVVAWREASTSRRFVRRESGPSLWLSNAYPSYWSTFSMIQIPPELSVIGRMSRSAVSAISIVTKFGIII